MEARIKHAVKRWLALILCSVYADPDFRDGRLGGGSIC